MKDDVLKVKEKQEPPSDIQSSFRSFFDTESHEYIVRKSEKLSAAIHIVTSYLKDSEPIRNRMRSVALDIVQIVSDAERLSANGQPAVIARCVEMASLLDTAELSRMIAKSNVSMIGTEYAALATFIRDRYTSMKHVLQLGASALSVERKSAQRNKPQPDEPNHAQTSRQTPQQTAVPNPFIVHQSSQTNPITESRRSQILNLVDDKGVISIKDAVAAISGVSEKTVQRELGSLVDDGVLKKTGERRWSTYSRAL